MSELSAQFESAFEALTGNKPLSWQTRLYSDYFAARRVPPVLDIPTGLGKTMVIAIWLIARQRLKDRIPTRLVYVVDRRTVVDQATDLAEEFAYLLSEDPAVDFALVEQRKPDLIERRRKYEQALGELRARLGQGLAVSTLRGQLADNREWSRDPTRPAIIIGTVDLIGSALLFSGYRSGSRRRPLEAGLLGMDSLVVLDEAHLSKPFERLLRSIELFSAPRNGSADLPVSPMRVVRMSATTSNHDQQCFKLEDADLVDPDPITSESPNRIVERINAPKTLKLLEPVESKKLNQEMADQATTLAKDNAIKGKRIVVFVRRPDDARAIAGLIQSHSTTKGQARPYADSVEVLTGTMRGLQRDELVDKPVLQRFLDGEERPGSKDDQPVFLVSTSAGEVGFDLNADHMVCDATTIDSLIQRLGRVNRRGYGQARIVLVPEAHKQKEGRTGKQKPIDVAIANTMKLLTDGMSLSPQNIATLKASDAWTKKTENGKSAYENACSPEPVTVPLTDILLDAWSMTSIRDKLPGRPDIAPWLRGVDEDQAQTSVAWRAEVDMLCGTDGADRALTAVFARHSIRPHETCAVSTRYLIKEFLERIPKLKDRPVNLLSTWVAIRLPRGQVICMTLSQLIKEPGVLYADSTLILPARFGGLSNGMLDPEAIPKAAKPDDPEPSSLDVADQPGYEQVEDAPARCRVHVLFKDDQWIAQALDAASALPEDVSRRLEGKQFAKTTPLFDALRGTTHRIRLVQPIAFDHEGDPTELLVFLAPLPSKQAKLDQSLDEHVSEVERNAAGIADRLSLSADHPIRKALRFAAKWHDEGKKARVWQIFANNPDPEHGPPLGKMARSRDPRWLRGYRHEFGSILRLHHPDRHETCCSLPDDPVVRDLALHLIAAHHGAGRPHFAPAVYHSFTEAERDACHTDAIRRFARLQRTYGWWGLAWLENLLRCADAMASAGAGSTGDEDEEEVDA